MAIAYSYKLVLQKGLEPNLGYEAANFALVRFPNGAPGAFVALGATGITRGYQILYRIRNNQLELVQLTPTGICWGVRSLRGSISDFKTDIEFLDLFATTKTRPQQIIKVTGAGHAGSGLWDDGYFQVLAITENGFSEIFTGLEATTNMTTFDTHHQYQFVDLDGDGNKEIIEDEKRCDYRLDIANGEKRDLGCTTSRKTFRFDGTRYTPIA